MAPGRRGRPSARVLDDRLGTADLPSPEEVIADTKRIARETLDEVVNAHPELAAAEFNVEAIAGPPGPVLVDASEAPTCSCWVTATAER